MNAAVLISGDLSGREGAAYMSPSRPPRRDRGHAAHLIKTVECNALSSDSCSTIYGSFSSTVWRAVKGLPIRTIGKYLKPARLLNSGRPFGAGNLSRPLVKPAKQPSGCLFKCLHVSVASAFHDQERSNGVLVDVPKSAGEITNV